jgi:four helix bundle protein
MHDMGQGIQRFEDITAWQRARDLVRKIYEVSATDSFFRDFALRDQIRRSALSVMSNIAEGFERHRDTEFAYFLRVAKASCGEVRSQVYVASDVGHISPRMREDLLSATAEVARVVHGFQAYLKSVRGTRD